MTTKDLRALAPAATVEDNTPSIRVVEFEETPDRGAIKALVDLEINGMIIRRCRVVRADGGKAFIGPPQHAWCFNGKRCYRNVVEWPSSWDGAILALVKAYAKEHEGD